MIAETSYLFFILLYSGLTGWICIYYLLPLIL